MTLVCLKFETAGYKAKRNTPNKQRQNSQNNTERNHERH